MTELFSPHLTPLLAITGYLAYPKLLRIDPTLLHWLSVIHNGVLVAFSAWTFVSLSQLLFQDGIVLQPNYYFQNPQFDYIIYLFYLSKYYEFFDTFLLYLNGKSPIFLQKYHHVGAVLGWHLCYFYKVDGIWLATLLNSFVHTVMYTYYLGCLLKINRVRIIKRYITSLQLCQLIPQPLSLYFYHMEPHSYILLFFTFYTIGLVILFLQFYHRTYLSKKEIKQELVMSNERNPFEPRDRTPDEIERLKNVPVVEYHHPGLPDSGLERTLHERWWWACDERFHTIPAGEHVLVRRMESDVIRDYVATRTQTGWKRVMFRYPLGETMTYQHSLK